MGVTDRERLLDSAVEETPATQQAPVALQPVVETSPPQAFSAALESEAVNIPMARAVNTPVANQQIIEVPEHIVNGQWESSFCDCCSTTAGCNSWWMAWMWPVCGPCLFAKIAARVRWQGWGRLGASPHQQWLRAGLIFIACYWFVTFNYIVFSALTASQMMHDAKAYGEKDTAEDFWDDPLSEQAKWLLDILKIFDFWHFVGSIALFVILMIMRQRVARHVHATNEGCQPFDDPGPADLLPQGFTYPNVQGGGNMTVVTTGATAPPQNYMYGGAAGVVQGNAVQEAEVAAGAPIPRAVLASEEPGAPPAKP